jgi:hypothetical protein
MLSENVHDSNRFEVVAPGRRRPVRFGRDTLGVLTQYRGDDVCAMRDETLRQLSRSTGVVKEVVRQLNGCNLLKGGHGRRRTTQLPPKICVNGKSLTKPRFLLIDADGLAKLARAPSKPAGHHASGGR